ncbi:hypothetical protein GUJ93_ZPchr0005g16041 [Zizania palustris]|uniref:Uncharacterized protein n=1 Tax=Zizania palustris TaxID=103762 RepID=A0A8J5SVR4_ZIZPA|nr:hypothetical protein GUJ93_ZPchr0005g16041 [Zizania palustris]
MFFLPFLLRFNTLSRLLRVPSFSLLSSTALRSALPSPLLASRCTLAWGARRLVFTLPSFRTDISDFLCFRRRWVYKSASLRRIISEHFDVYFHLWHDGGPSWHKDFRKWSAKERTSWTSVHRRKPPSSFVRRSSRPPVHSPNAPFCHHKSSPVPFRRSKAVKRVSFSNVVTFSPPSQPSPSAPGSLRVGDLLYPLPSLARSAPGRARVHGRLAAPDLRAIFKFNSLKPSLLSSGPSACTNPILPRPLSGSTAP